NSLLSCHISAPILSVCLQKRNKSPNTKPSPCCTPPSSMRRWSRWRPRSGSTSRRCFIRFLNRKNKREVFAIPMCKEAAGMSQETAFAVFCIENYKVHKSLTGKHTEALFRRYGVFDYLREFYDVLH